jgi:hypothetical protein
MMCINNESQFKVAMSFMLHHSHSSQYEKQSWHQYCIKAGKSSWCEGHSIGDSIAVVELQPHMFPSLAQVMSCLVRKNSEKHPK